MLRLFSECESRPFGISPRVRADCAILFLITMGFSGLGPSVASQVENLEVFQLVIVFLALPLFLLSGALFPVTSMPVWNGAININSLTCAVDALRYAIVGLRVPSHARPQHRCGIFCGSGRCWFELRLLQYL